METSAAEHRGVSEFEPLVWRDSRPASDGSRLREGRTVFGASHCYRRRQEASVRSDRKKIGIGPQICRKTRFGLARRQGDASPEDRRRPGESGTFPDASSPANKRRLRVDCTSRAHRRGNGQGIVGRSYLFSYLDAVSPLIQRAIQAMASVAKKVGAVVDKQAIVKLFDSIPETMQSSMRSATPPQGGAPRSRPLTARS